MNPPGPISEVKEIFENYNTTLQDKWSPFARYTMKKYSLKFELWNNWCNWYLKRIKCEEILK